MNEKSKRQWFQFHLSTAVVLMVVVSLLLFLDVEVYQSVRANMEANTGRNGLDWADTLGICLAVIVHLLLLLGTWQACEWWIRRRERLKTERP